VNLAEENDIYRQLPVFLSALRAGTLPLPDAQKIQRYARRNQARELAKCLDELKYGTSAPVPQKAESCGR